ncbi:DUF6265 family protein [Pyxidicoccus sp. MSG2]|uniref:DUF6265 family protein n=1 Tax=Pyxidicoccus sp. MSG2 TaxID=2996790 RepID=UPI00226D69EF|nr:DUF6265 family protein [Pyxidicoccus sp. MSG2]MCY1021116.1 DUF6265 family protein [Pyxidicoccus sp. MSG2]
MLSRFLIVLCGVCVGVVNEAQAQPQAKSLSELSFMAGCWRGGETGKNEILEERFSPPAGDLMLGTSQVVASGKTAFFEFIKIEASADGITMTPSPMGKPSVAFKMVSLDGKKAVFENLKHDFPKRIIYELRDDGSLAARIEGDKPKQTQEFAMKPIPCGTGSLANYRLKWGMPGRGVGQYSNPTAIAQFKDPFGMSTLVFADTNNHRVRLSTWNGMFIEKWGEEGSGPGQFRYPQGVAVNNQGDIVIADSGNNRIQVTAGAPENMRELPGKFRFTFGRRGTGKGEFEEPSGVAVDQDGNIYVSDAGNHRIQKFDDQGRFLATWGARGRKTGEFDRPMGLAVDRANKWLYVTDTDNGRVQKFDLGGKFLHAWGDSGVKLGQMYRPKGITVDPRSSNVYVVDSNNHRIQKFTSDGASLGIFGRNGTADGELWFPFGVAVDEKGQIFITDSENGRIQMFQENHKVAELYTQRVK